MDGRTDARATEHLLDLVRCGDGRSTKVPSFASADAPASDLSLLSGLSPFFFVLDLCHFGVLVRPPFIRIHSHSFLLSFNKAQNRTHYNIHHVVVSKVRWRLGHLPVH